MERGKGWRSAQYFSEVSKCISHKHFHACFCRETFSNELPPLSERCMINFRVEELGKKVPDVSASFLSLAVQCKLTVRRELTADSSEF